MANLMLVDDEPAVVELLALNLRHHGHTVRAAGDADAARQAVRERLPDLVLLDWMLPGASGLVLAREWRREARTRDLPILMLTACGQEDERVQGLDAGADDYMAKPFSIAELVARVRALLRRRLPQADDRPLQVGPLALDPTTLRVHLQGRHLRMGPAEFRLLRFFMSHPERVHTRAQLLDRVWGDHVFIEERTVDVHIKRLREHLGDAATLIETVRGVGYRLVQPTLAAPGVVGAGR